MRFSRHTAYEYPPTARFMFNRLVTPFLLVVCWRLIGWLALVFG